MLGILESEGFVALAKETRGIIQYRVVQEGSLPTGQEVKLEFT